MQVDHDPHSRVAPSRRRTRLSVSPRRATFRNVKTIAECLADELINAAKGSSNSCSNPIRKDDEVNCDLFLRAASQVQRLFRVKNKFHSKTNTSIFRDKPSSDKS